MGVRETFQAGAQSIRQAFGNVFEPMTYLVVLDQPTYNPTTQVAVWWQDPPLSNIPVALLDYSVKERATGQYQPEDERGLIAALDAPLLRPKPGDLIRRASGDVREVVAVVNAGGVDALWDLQTRPAKVAWPVP